MHGLHHVDAGARRAGDHQVGVSALNDAKRFADEYAAVLGNNEVNIREVA